MWFLCVVGIDDFIVCLVGLYSLVIGFYVEYECLNCSGGEFCNIIVLIIIIGRCSVGYYCLLRFINKEEVFCSLGYFCKVGIFYFLLCFFGIYLNSIKF